MPDVRGTRTIYHLELEYRSGLLDRQFSFGCATEDNARIFVALGILIKNKNKKTAHKLNQKAKLRGFSPHANCTDRATAACRRS
jgi:hypothetical protein